MSGIAAITAESLGKTYYLGVRRRPVVALIKVDFEVRQGEVFAFLGLNGAGKTTTIKLLLDHARPSTGRSLLFGVDSREPSSRSQVGYMPDLPNFYRFLTAIELLDYFGRLHALGLHDRSSRTRELIELVGLKGRETEPLRGYSRGMLQRVGLAQALISNPSLLILDEPLGGLDPFGRFEFHSIIRELKDQGKTIFFSSHILEDAEKIADRVGIIRNGSLIAVGTLEGLIQQPGGFDVEINPGNDREKLEYFASQRGWRIVHADLLIVVTVPLESAVQELIRCVSETTASVHSISPRRRTLEEAFIEELDKWDR